jgi:hypothetical protein
MGHRSDQKSRRRPLRIPKFDQALAFAAPEGQKKLAGGGTTGNRKKRSPAPEQL